MFSNQLPSFYRAFKAFQRFLERGLIKGFTAVLFNMSLILLVQGPCLSETGILFVNHL